MRTTTDIRDRLKRVQAELSEARTDRAAARKTRDEAREAFAQARDQSPSGAPYKRAMQAVDALAEVDSKIEELGEVNVGILRMLGDGWHPVALGAVRLLGQAGGRLQAGPFGDDRSRTP